MFIIEGIITGVIATALFDLYQICLFYSYNIDKTRWNFVGRYFVGLKDGKFFQKDLFNERNVKNELLLGYLIHYLIGIIYGIFYIILNMIFFSSPSILLALIIGFMTVLGGWCIMMPLAFNLGFFASKEKEQKKILVQNLMAHFIFGIGLFIGYSIII